MGNSSDPSRVLGALIVGAAIGATLGVLFAPKKGKEIREEIADKAKKMSKDMKQKYQDLKNTASTEMENFKDRSLSAEYKMENKAENLKDNFGSKYDSAKNYLQDKVDSVADGVKL